MNVDDINIGTKCGSNGLNDRVTTLYFHIKPNINFYGGIIQLNVF